LIHLLHADALEQATPEQRKQLANKMREEVKMAAAGQNAEAINNLDDDQLLEIMRCVVFKICINHVLYSLLLIS
jgi:hypothetical protein